MRVLAALFALLAPFATAPASAAPPCVCLECLTGPYQHFRAVSASMTPVLVTDHCAVFNMRPETAPQPGDVVLFSAPAYHGPIMFRVIATGGQRIAVVDGVPVIDGQPAVREAVGAVSGAEAELGCHALGPDCMVARWRETLPNGASYDVLDAPALTIMDHMPEMVVPEGHVFLMGDNRDNANDSRIPAQRGGAGPVPLQAVAGILTRIIGQTAP